MSVEDADLDADAPWQPTASLELLRFRADRLAAVRQFFKEHHVLEVETPLLAHGGSVDPCLESLALEATTPAGREPLWLQTSPEFHMKRLLAAGSGPIYQIFRAFRDGERGKRHNLEFSLLEWYQPGYGLELLREECVELFERVLQRPVQLRVHRYRELFQQYLGIDPFTTEDEKITTLAGEASGREMRGTDRDECLDLLFSHRIEPHLGGLTTWPVVVMDAVIDYPASQAALARKRRDPADGVLVAARFELYWQGIELANGYDELCDAEEQATRFDADREARSQLGKPDVQADQHLLAAMAHGLPACSGVAVGLDRLIMLAAGQTDLASVVAFPIERA